MATISLELIKELRESTGVGMNDVKQALDEAEGDREKAVEILRKKGLATRAKKAGRAAKEGVVEAYVHAGGKVGVLLEINCETDFVARNDDFKQLAREVAMHIAAANPLYVSVEDIAEEVIEKEREIAKEQALAEGKPEAVLEKIVEGRVAKFYQEAVLLNQPFIKDPSITISDLLGQSVGKMGENIQVKRFVRFSLGEHAA
jgi:elongation factor Ts